MPVRCVLLTDISKKLTLNGVAQEAVNSRLGRADNERFLEHFRYIIVASGLLSEQPFQTSGRFPNTAPSPNGSLPSAPFKSVQSNVNGALLTGSAAFALVWFIHWAKGSQNESYKKGRLSVVIATFILSAIVVYAYVRRQWLKYLRRQSVEAASALMTNFQAFHASMTSSLSFIQEVELISRGYRL